MILNKRMRQRFAKSPLVNAAVGGLSASFWGIISTVVGALVPPFTGPLVIVGSALYAASSLSDDFKPPFESIVKAGLEFQSARTQTREQAERREPMNNDEQ